MFHHKRTIELLKPARSLTEVFSPVLFCYSICLRWQAFDSEVDVGRSCLELHFAVDFRVHCWRSVTSFAPATSTIISFTALTTAALSGWTLMTCCRLHKRDWLLTIEPKQVTFEKKRRCEWLLPNIQSTLCSSRDAVELSRIHSIVSKPTLFSSRKSS